MEVFFNNTLYKGAKASWSSSVKNPKLFDELDVFISNNKKEYIICFYSYDLKNNIENLTSNNKDEISAENFFSKYGHLRPSSYDILSPRYNDRRKIFDGEAFSPLVIEKFEWNILCTLCIKIKNS